MNSYLPARAVFLSQLSFLMQLFRASGITQPGRADFVGAPVSLWGYYEQALQPEHSQGLIFFLGLLAGTGLFLSHSLGRVPIRILMSLLLLSEAVLLSLDLRLCGRFALLLLLATFCYIVAEEAGARSWLAVLPASALQGVVLWPLLLLARLPSRYQKPGRTLLLVALVIFGLQQSDTDLLLLSFPIALDLPEEAPPTTKPLLLAALALALAAPLFWVPQETTVRIILAKSGSVHELEVKKSGHNISVILDGQPLRAPWRKGETILCNPMYFNRCEPFALGFQHLFRCYCAEVTRRAQLDSAEFQRLPNP